MPDDRRPTDGERNRAFRKEATRQRRRMTAMQRDLAKEITRLLKVAEADIAGRLAAAASSYDEATLPSLQASIRAALDELERGVVPGLVRGAGDAWQIGVDQVDLPIDAGLSAGGRPAASIRAVLPSLDTQQLRATRVFLTDRGRDITVTMANRINAELGLTIIGAQSPSAVVPKVAGILDSGRSRAITLVRTELGRVYAKAGQERMAQAKEVLPGMKKQWRRSGKLHARPEHVAADGQVQDVDKPFIIAGVQLMYPRDPAGPAEHTINCGCDSLPFMEHWEVKNPDRQPFTERELAGSRFARDLDSAVPSGVAKEPAF